MSPARLNATHPRAWQPDRRAALLGAVIACATGLSAGLNGCAVLPGQDPLRFNVVGVEAAPGEGLELRFLVKLRVQNPNDTAIDYDGVALDLEVNGRSFASGVSNAQGSVPRYGEKVVAIPISVSAFSAVRQALGLSEVSELDQLPFVLRGKLSSGPFGSLRFTDEGKLSLGSALRANGAGTKSGTANGNSKEQRSTDR